MSVDHLSKGNPDGTVLGQSATDKVSLYGVTPVARAAAPTAQAAASPAGGVGAAAGGWDTAANRDTAIAAINNNRTRIAEIETALRSLGLLT